MHNEAVSIIMKVQRNDVPVGNQQWIVDSKQERRTLCHMSPFSAPKKTDMLTKRKGWWDGAEWRSTLFEAWSLVDPASGMPCVTPVLAVAEVEIRVQ